jgi:hypothetical protein
MSRPQGALSETGFNNDSRSRTAMLLDALVGAAVKQSRIFYPIRCPANRYVHHTGYEARHPTLPLPVLAVTP